VWVWDWFGSYLDYSETDPMGVSSGSFRAVRGGSWSYSDWYVHSAIRGLGYPAERFFYLGFQLVRP